MERVDVVEGGDEVCLLQSMKCSCREEGHFQSVQDGIDGLERKGYAVMSIFSHPVSIRIAENGVN